MKIEEVPSRIDLQKMDDAIEWERTAMDRPFRLDFFDKFLSELQQLNRSNLSILELGSGPGYLANHILTAMPKVEISLLDFSGAMHELAKKRIALHLKRATFVERDFKQSGWYEGLGLFDAVITNQAVHELRHKQYAQTLHEQVKHLLKEGGLYLVCDHIYEVETAKNNQLFMDLDEYRESLTNAGYSISEVLKKGGRILCRAAKSG